MSGGNQYLPPQGRAGASDLPPISDDEFASTVEQVRNRESEHPTKPRNHAHTASTVRRSQTSVTPTA